MTDKISIKDFSVGQEVIYLDFNGRSSFENAKKKTGYVIKVGRKLITISRFANSNYGYDFVIEPNKQFLHTSEKYCHVYDLVFKNSDDYDTYLKLRKLKFWASRFHFDKLPYDKLLMIHDIATQEE